MLVGASGNIGIRNRTGRLSWAGANHLGRRGARQTLNGSAGSVLDPVSALRCRETLEPEADLSCRF